MLCLIEIEMNTRRKTQGRPYANVLYVLQAISTVWCCDHLLSQHSFYHQQLHHLARIKMSCKVITQGAVFVSFIHFETMVREFDNLV